MKQTDRQTDIWRCLSVQYFWGCCVAATIDGAGGGGGFSSRPVGQGYWWHGLLSHPILWSGANKTTEEEVRQ